MQYHTNNNNHDKNIRILIFYFTLVSQEVFSNAYEQQSCEEHLAIIIINTSRITILSNCFSIIGEMMYITKVICSLNKHEIAW